MKRCLSSFLAIVIIISLLPAFGGAREYITLQDFERYNIGDTNIQISTPACMIDGQEGSSFVVEYAPKSTNKALHIQTDTRELGKSATGNVYMTVNYLGNITFEARIMPMDHNTQRGFSVQTKVNGSKTFLIMSNGIIKPYSGDPSASLSAYAMPYNLGEWMDIKLALDVENGTYDYWLNGELICDDLKLPGRDGFFSEYIIYRAYISTSTSKGNYTETYMDDLKAYINEDVPGIQTTKIKEEGYEDLLLKWRPADKSISYSNPPKFAWPAIPQGSSYTIQLSRKADMSEIKYEHEVEKSYYVPNYLLEKGVWYWRVRGVNGNGATDWSTIKRFRIPVNSVDSIIPSAEEMVDMIPDTHPRLWFVGEDVDLYKKAVSEGDAKVAFDSFKAVVDKNLSDMVAEEPQWIIPEGATTNEKKAIKIKFRNTADGLVKQMYDAAFVYMVTGEQKYADKAIAFLDDIADWDPDGVTSYGSHDQVHRNIVLKSAIVYDWLYPQLSEATKEKVLAMALKRTNVMYKPLFIRYPIDQLPYDSHGRTVTRMIMTISSALMHDIPDAREWFMKSHNTYYYSDSWSGEDGGNAMGTGYSNGTLMPETLARDDMLKTMTGYDVLTSAQNQRTHKYFMYFFSNGAPTGFAGDDATIPPIRESASLARYIVHGVAYNNGALIWASETRGNKPYINEPLLYKFYNHDVESVPPFEYLNSYHDRDIGWVSMKSDLIDPQHVGISFKSSWWGGISHCHADQNSFIVYAYGEPLAVDSGYFDYANSEHDKNYSRQTFAHNAITYNGGQGQYYLNPDQVRNINAKGKITGYLHGDKFNLASGDAERAYLELDKAERHFIYLKPDYAIVIDELSSNDDEKVQFEFNLKGYSPFEVDEDESKAVVTQGRAKLSASFLYPEAERIEQFDRFIGLDGKEYRPSVNHLPKRKDHYGVRFDTEKTSDTVMVTTLDILKADEEEKDVTVNKNDECMEITVEGDKKIYVRLDYKDEEVSYGNVTFKGTAAVFDGDSFMLVNGTELVKDGVTLVSADKPAHFSFEGGELHVFGSEDGKVSFNLPYEVTEIKDEEGYETKRYDSDEYDYDIMAYKWTQDSDNVLSIEYEAGRYNMYLNGTKPMKYDELAVRINGKPAQYINKPFSENGTTYVPLIETVEMYNAAVTVDNGKYTVSKTRESYGDYTEKERKDRTMVLYADSDKAVFNGSDITLSKPTIMKDGILYIPLRAYYEVFTDRIGWSDYAKTAWVYTEPVYMDDLSSTAYPRTDIMTEEEYEEYLSKKD